MVVGSEETAKGCLGGRKNSKDWRTAFTSGHQKKIGRQVGVASGWSGSKPHGFVREAVGCALNCWLGFCLTTHGDFCITCGLLTVEGGAIKCHSNPQFTLSPQASGVSCAAVAIRPTGSTLERKKERRKKSQGCAGTAPAVIPCHKPSRPSVLGLPARIGARWVEACRRTRRGGEHAGVSVSRRAGLEEAKLSGCSLLLPLPLPLRFRGDACLMDRASKVKMGKFDAISFRLIAFRLFKFEIVD